MDRWSGVWRTKRRWTPLLEGQAARIKTLIELGAEDNVTIAMVAADGPLTGTA